MANVLTELLKFEEQRLFTRRGAEGDVMDENADQR